MIIYVDADSCPVTKIIEKVSEENDIEVVLICDTSHIQNSDYSNIIIVDKGAEAADIALINECHSGDIAVTQDYGVAALVLGKGAYAIHPNGIWFTDNNIEGLLAKRHRCKTAARKRKIKIEEVKQEHEENETVEGVIDDNIESLVLNVPKNKLPKSNKQSLHKKKISSKNGNDNSKCNSLSSNSKRICETVKGLDEYHTSISQINDEYVDIAEDAIKKQEIIDVIQIDEELSDTSSYYEDLFDEDYSKRKPYAVKRKKKNRKAHLKGVAKRTVEDDKRFEESFIKLIKYATNK